MNAAVHILEDLSLADPEEPVPACGDGDLLEARAVQPDRRRGGSAHPIASSATRTTDRAGTSASRAAASAAGSRLSRVTIRV